MSVKGFAVELDGVILIRTVSDTEAAAQVNGLVLCFDVTPTLDWPEEHVQAVWFHHLQRTDPSRGLRIVPVVVEPVKPH